MGFSLPEDAEIHSVAVEIKDDRTFGTNLSPALERIYPRLLRDIQRLVLENLVRRIPFPKCDTKPSSSPSSHQGRFFS